MPETGMASNTKIKVSQLGMYGIGMLDWLKEQVKFKEVHKDLHQWAVWK